MTPSSVMTPSVVFAIAAADLRRLLRSPIVVLATVLGPLALGAVLALAIGGSGTVDVGVVDRDGTPISTGIVDGLLRADASGVRLHRIDSFETARAAVEASDPAAVIVIPEGYGASTTVAPLPLEVIGDPSAGLSVAIARAIAEGVAGGTDAVRVRLDALGRVDPAAVTAETVTAASAAQASLTVANADESLGSTPDGIVFFGPAMVFLFFAVGGAARSLLDEERAGTLVRLRAAPVAAADLIAAKGVVAVIRGGVSLFGVWGLSSLVFGASWGPPPAVAMVLVLVTVATASIAGLVVALARTPRQAEGWNSIITFGAALVGGSFVAPGSLPGWLARLSLLTPNGLGSNVLAEIGPGGRSLPSQVAPLLGLVVFVVVLGVPSAVLLGRRLAQ